ncbi:TPA: hypothetical protein ACH3X1_005392 [Trebouxia sp. C0004]
MSSAIGDTKNLDSPDSSDLGCHQEELNSLKKAPAESIAEFVARAKELATNLEAVGHKPEDSEVSLSVLAGLPKDKVLVTILGTHRP